MSDAPVVPPADDADPVVVRTRRKRVATVEIPEEIHAVAVLTGTDPETLVEQIVAEHVTELRAKAAALLGKA